MTVEPAPGASVDVALSTYADDDAAEHVAANIDELQGKLFVAKSCWMRRLPPLRLLKALDSRSTLSLLVEPERAKQNENAYR
eukprot:11836918-Alexandrium_andersonii.AAC.1